MLSKFAHVTPDGRYIQPPHAKISYGGVRSKYSRRCDILISFFVDGLYTRQVSGWLVVWTRGLSPFSLVTSIGWWIARGELGF